MTVLASREFERVAPSGYYRATAKLDHLDGNARPHFSLTGEHWKSKAYYLTHVRTGSERGLLCCGAMGDTLVKKMKKLTAFERMHLSDDTGAPMHAAENGWYWYSDYDGKGTHLNGDGEFAQMTPHERAKYYLRAAALPEGLDKEQFFALVEMLRPQWQAEADAAVAFLNDDREES